MASARTAALRLLSRRDYTTHELRAKLVDRDYSEAEVAECVDGLQGQGLLDDRRAAAAHVRTASRVKNRGRLRIQRELEARGLARDVIRQVQDLRKTAGLQMEHRIELCLGTESDALRQAIAAHRDYVAAETLTVRWADAPLDGADVRRADVKIDGQALSIMLRKAPS